jgi:hypothetical protein
VTIQVSPIACCRGSAASNRLSGPCGEYWATYVGFVASIGVAAVWYVCFPALRRIDRFEDIEPADASTL